MPLTNRISFYDQLALRNKEKLQNVKRKLSFNSFLRLAVFLAGAVAVYIFYRNTTVMGISLAFTTVSFLFLLVRHGKLTKEKERCETLLKISEDELKAFAHDFSAFNGASERIDPGHDFSFDLDVFGEKSLFQVLNRTSLKIGKERLADFLEKPLDNKAKIQERQQAVTELAQKQDFCLEFRVTGHVSGNIFSSLEDVKNTFSLKEYFRFPLVWKLLTIFVPVAYVIYIGCILTGWTSGSSFLLVYLSTLGLSSVPLKKVKAIWLNFDKKAKALSTYSELFKHAETATFNSILLQKLQQKIAEGKKASKSIEQLAKYIQNLDQSFAFPVLLIVNPLFLWNVLFALKTESWLKKNHKKAKEWFSALAEMDALVSLAAFTSNNPDYTFPEIADRFCVQGQQLGHPLIPRGKCVKNDIVITRKPYFMIVTGANMAGKSTYLRTVGINHLLASIGAPVCAETFCFYPGRLLTNLRTADSLVNNESYFFAELKRLKMIIDSLESGENGLFIILDEILKGTNSEDKQKGSFALMRRLIHLGGSGIIATHDLALGELENGFPDTVKNVHFDADISNDTLSFTYKIQEGIARNMNASFLMKTMGITE